MELRNLTRVRIRVRLGSGFWLGSGFRSGIWKLHMRDFEIAQLQKSRTMILACTINVHVCAECLYGNMRIAYGRQ